LLQGHFKVVFQIRLVYSQERERFGITTHERNKTAQNKRSNKNPQTVSRVEMNGKNRRPMTQIGDFVVG